MVLVLLQTLAKPSTVILWDTVLCWTSSTIAHIVFDLRSLIWGLAKAVRLFKAEIQSPVLAVSGFSSICCLNLLSRSRAIGVRSFLTRTFWKASFLDDEIQFTFSPRSIFHLSCSLATETQTGLGFSDVQFLDPRRNYFFNTSDNSYLGGDQFINCKFHHRSSCHLNFRSIFPPSWTHWDSFFLFSRFCISRIFDSIWSEWTGSLNDRDRNFLGINRVAQLWDKHHVNFGKWSVIILKLRFTPLLKRWGKTVNVKVVPLPPWGSRRVANFYAHHFSVSTGLAWRLSPFRRFY